MTIQSRTKEHDLDPEVTLGKGRQVITFWVKVESENMIRVQLWISSTVRKSRRR